MTPPGLSFVAAGPSGRRRPPHRRAAHALLGLDRARGRAALPEILRHAAGAPAVRPAQGARSAARGGPRQRASPPSPARRGGAPRGRRLGRGRRPRLQHHRTCRARQFGHHRAAWPRARIRSRCSSSARSAAASFSASGSARLSGKALRIAHMGHVNAPMILGTLGALEVALVALDIAHGKGGAPGRDRLAGRCHPGLSRTGGRGRNRTADQGFAVPCIATLLPGPTAQMVVFYRARQRWSTAQRSSRPAVKPIVAPARRRYSPARCRSSWPRSTTSPHHRERALPMDYARARLNMVANQLRPNRIEDPRLLDAMREVPRERFLPKLLRGVAYADEDLLLPGGGHLIEPLVARAADPGRAGSGRTRSSWCSAARPAMRARSLARLAATVILIQPDQTATAQIETPARGARGRQRRGRGERRSERRPSEPGAVRRDPAGRLGRGRAAGAAASSSARAAASSRWSTTAGSARARCSRGCTA